MKGLTSELFAHGLCMLCRKTLDSERLDSATAFGCYDSERLTSATAFGFMTDSLALSALEALLLVHPLLPGVFLALLLKNHSRCVLNSLSPLLHKAELPTYAHIINNEQATLCSIFSKYNSFTILQQSVKDEEMVPEVLSLYFQHQRESEDLFPHRLADRFCTLACLIYDKELAASRSRSLFSLTNASAKTSLSV